MDEQRQTKDNPLVALEQPHKKKIKRSNTHNKIGQPSKNGSKSEIPAVATGPVCVAAPTQVLTQELPPKYTDKVSDSEFATCCAGRVYVDTAKLAYLSLCFMVLLAALTTCLSLVGPLFQQIGIISLSLQNVGVALGSLVGSAIVDGLGERITMFGSAVIYTGFIALMQLNIPWVVLVASVVRGFSGGTLWIAQAAYLSALSQRHPGQLGRMSGLFFGVFSVHIVVGGLIIGIPLLLSDTPAQVAGIDGIRTTLWLLLGISGFATILFAFIRPSNSSATVPPERLLAHLRGTFGLLKNSTMRYLLVWAFMYGFVICFMWGPLTTMFNNVRLTPMLLIPFGGTFIVSSLVTGHLYDTVGWKPLLFIYCGASAIAYVVFIVGYELQIPVLFFVAAAVFGWVESLFGTLHESAFIKTFGSNASRAFGLANFVQSFGQVTSYLLAAYVPYWIILTLNSLMLIFGTFMFYWTLTPHGKHPLPSPLPSIASPKTHHR